MRFLGALLFVLGGAGAAFCTWGMYTRGRPRDVAFAVLSPVAVALALVGLVLLFVPGFLG